MDLPYSKDELREVTHELIGRNGFKSCYIRPLVYRGHGPMGLYPLNNPVEVTIACWEWGAYLGDEAKQNGVRAHVSSWRRISHDSLIPHAKASGQYLNCVLAKIERREVGLRGGDPARRARLRLRGHRRERLRRQGRRDLHAGPHERDPRRHQPHVDLRDREGPRHRDGRARHRPLRADAGRRGVPHRHRGRADADAVDRRSSRSATASPARSPASSSASSRTPSTAATRATASGSTSCAYPQRRDLDLQEVRPNYARDRALSPARAIAGRARDSSNFPEGNSMPKQVQLYDTTLRDGMQGEGMSLSMEEKLRVAHALDELGVHLIEAGFLGSNPKDEALFGRLADETLQNAEIAAFGMTRRRDAEGRRGSRVAAAWPSRSSRSARWSARPGRCTSRRSPRSTRDENLAMIGDSVAFLVKEGKRVVYDAEHFFDAYRDDPEYALLLPADRRRCRRRDRRAVRHQRRLAAGPDRGGACAPSTLRVSASTRTTTPAAASPTRWWRCAAGARQVQGTMNGYGERNGNCNIVSVIPALQLKMGFECVTAEQLANLTDDRPPRRRDLQPVAGPEPALRGPQRVRAQGRHARRRHPRRRAHVRAHGPGRGRQRRAPS